VYTLFSLHCELEKFPMEKTYTYNTGANENTDFKLNNFIMWTYFQVQIPSIWANEYVCWHTWH